MVAASNTLSQHYAYQIYIVKPLSTPPLGRGYFLIGLNVLVVFFPNFAAKRTCALQNTAYAHMKITLEQKQTTYVVSHIHFAQPFTWPMCALQALTSKAFQ